MKLETSDSLGKKQGNDAAGWLLLASLDTLLRSELHDEPQHMVKTNVLSDKADQL